MPVSDHDTVKRGGSGPHGHADPPGRRQARREEEEDMLVNPPISAAASAFGNSAW